MDLAYVHAYAKKEKQIQGEIHKPCHNGQAAVNVNGIVSSQQLSKYFRFTFHETAEKFAENCREPAREIHMQNQVAM